MLSAYSVVENAVAGRTGFKVVTDCFRGDVFAPESGFVVGRLGGLIINSSMAFSMALLEIFASRHVREATFNGKSGDIIPNSGREVRGAKSAGSAVSRLGGAAAKRCRLMITNKVGLSGPEGR